MILFQFPARPFILISKIDLILKNVIHYLTNECEILTLKFGQFDGLREKKRFTFYPTNKCHPSVLARQKKYQLFPIVEDKLLKLSLFKTKALQLYIYK